MHDAKAKLLQAQVLTGISLCHEMLEVIEKVSPIEVREQLANHLEGLLTTSCNCIEMCDELTDGELS